MTGFEVVVPPDYEPEEPDHWTEHDEAVKACVRDGGHRWLLDGTPGEEPSLECEDCPANTGDLTPDCFVLLDGAEQELGGRTVVFGEPLPDDAEPYTIPVDVEIEGFSYWTDYGTEYDIEVHISEREVTA